MQTPILRRYNKAVFYTYLSVALVALLVAGLIFERVKSQLLERKQVEVAQMGQQVERMTDAAVLTLQSLGKFAESRVARVRSGAEMAQILDQFVERGEIFDLAPAGADMDNAMGWIGGLGSLDNLSVPAQRELAMVHDLAVYLPVAKRQVPNASRLYFASPRGMATLYPWPERPFSQGLKLHLGNAFSLGTPERNPERSLYRLGSQDRLNKAVTMGLPVYQGDQFLGAIMMDLPFQQLSADMASYVDLPGTVLLLDEQNRLISYTAAKDDERSTVSELSQKIPAALHAVPLSELVADGPGRLLSGYYVQTHPLQRSQWKLLYLQPESDLVIDAWGKLEITFLFLIVTLSVLLTVVHYLTRRAFISPAAKLLNHLERCAKEPQRPPANLVPGWEHWYELISRIFEENQQYTHHLAAQNRRLDNLVAKRTERLRLVNERQERDYSLLRSLIDAIPEAIVFKDIDGRYMGCNKAAEKVLGCAEADAIGRTISDLDPSERGRRIALEDARVLRDKAPLRYQEELAIRGKQRLMEVVRHPFYNSRGELLGLISIWRDITRDAEQQEQLRRSEQRYHLAMDAVEDGLWDWYLDSNQMFCNPAYYTMLGYEPNEFPLLVDTFYELMHPDDRGRVERYIDRYLEAPGQNYHLEFRLRGKTGGYHWILSRGRAVEFDEDGEPTRLLGTHKDITLQKEHEVALLEAKQDAELANRTKSEFLANMSHEIRTPMNAVLGMLHLALRTQLDNRQRDYLDKARFSAESLLRIINDILDFSKIEAGKLELEQTEFALDKVLEHAMAINAIKAQEKDVELLLYAPVTAGLTILGDPLRLGQVLVNLLSNAVKFTEQGEVELGCEDIKQQDGRVSLKFWVRDTGIGIPRAQQEKLFDAFSQADGSTTRQFGGTGLGLSISKHLVAMMGGDIQVQSEPGQGTTFSFTIDAEKVAQPSAKVRVLPKEIDGLKALVVDDNPTALQIYATYLRDFRFQVESVDTGEQALQELKRWQPDLLLLDWMMPGMDGTEVLDAVDDMVRSGELARRPTVIMMTAYSGNVLQQERQAGRIQALMQKPFQSSGLYNEVVSAFAQRVNAVPASVAAPEEPEPAGEDAHILLVEDNLINQQVATELLKSAGYQVSLAGNGADAVEQVKSGGFDLVLMDIQMPVMDGLEATRVIRRDNTHLPIIAMTAHAMTGDREKSLDAGMNDHITKPIVLPQLFDTLKHWLKQT